ncbi:MAG: C-GCAxxG-C-C family protein [Eubacteriales bacterium]|nr:C-GCAxxG-C-C family protein [Eubacteriales bacterium]MDD4512653.1 C-GCAxxG-C-C family protein [Eubacteriales bacterium]
MRGFSCAQSVLCAFRDVAGLTEEQALMLGGGLGAGIGRMRLTCGAFCAIAAVCGFITGNVSPDIAKRGETYALVQKLRDEFVTETGALECREILGLIADEKLGCEPCERTKEYYMKRPCVAVVAATCRILEKEIAAHKRGES